MPSRCSTTIFHLLVRSLIAFRASVSAVNGRFKQAAQIDLACQGGPPSARSAPGTRTWWLERHWGSGEGLAHPPLVQQHATARRARGPAHASRPGWPDLNTAARGARACAWRPRRVRSVKHLARHDALSLLDGCWGQTRDSDGPTEALLHVCLGSSC